MIFHLQDVFNLTIRVMTINASLGAHDGKLKKKKYIYMF